MREAVWRRREMSKSIVSVWGRGLVGLVSFVADSGREDAGVPGGESPPPVSASSSGSASNRAISKSSPVSRQSRM